MLLTDKEIEDGAAWNKKYYNDGAVECCNYKMYKAPGSFIVEEQPRRLCVMQFLGSNMLRGIAFSLKELPEESKYYQRFYEYFLSQESPWRHATKDIIVTKDTDTGKITGYVLSLDVPNVLASNFVIASRYVFEWRLRRSAKLWCDLVDAGIDKTISLYLILHFIYEKDVVRKWTVPYHSAFNTIVSLQRLLNVDNMKNEFGVNLSEGGPVFSCNYIWNGSKQRSPLETYFSGVESVVKGTFGVTSSFAYPDFIEQAKRHVPVYLNSLREKKGKI